MPDQPIFDKPNTIVIGGAGFIGSHLCDELVKTRKVICIDNFVSGSHQNIQHLTGNPDFIFIRHDATIPIDVKAFPELERFKVEFQGIQEIYNLATPTSQKGYEKLLLETSYANSVLVKNALDLAYLQKSKLLHVSSHAIYGDPLKDQPHFSEDYWGFVNPVGPRCAYNEGKRFAEALVMNYHRQAGLDTKIARVFSTYGPRMAFETGRMIPDWIKAGAQGEPLTVYGTGEEKYNYLFVIDLVEGLVKLMDSEVHEPINLGNPDENTLTEIAEAVKELTGGKSKLNYTDALEDIMQPGQPNIQRAQKLLSWFPVTKLKDGLDNTVEDMMGRGAAKPTV